MISEGRVKLKILVVLFAMRIFNVQAFAQIDFSGEWFQLPYEDQQERRAGPLPGDYTGLPLNDAARMRADTQDASIIALPEWQCVPHPADYMPLGLSEMRIWKEVDPYTQEITAWHMHWTRSAADRVIYMDGRAHPSGDAAYTWEGFSTGKWEGNMLTTKVTHLKESFLRRNGVERSELATLTEHIFMNGDYLTWTTIIYDPAYLTEPLIRNGAYVKVPFQQIPATGGCQIIEEEVRPKGVVPHYLPGANPYLTEFATKNPELPPEAIRGFAETLYPEYQLKLREFNAAQK